LHIREQLVARKVFARLSMVRFGGLRKRVCILSKKEFNTLQGIYKGDGGATDLAALFLQIKWVEHVLQIIRGKKGKGLRLYHYLDERNSSKNEEAYHPSHPDGEYPDMKNLIAYARLLLLDIEEIQYYSRAR